MWTNKATEIVNNWLIQDPARVHLWQETALGAMQFSVLLGGDGTTRRATIAQIGNLLRLYVDRYRTELQPPELWGELVSDELRKVCWYEIAQAILDGAISREPGE